jgi:hypothetical protein
MAGSRRAGNDFGVPDVSRVDDQTQITMEQDFCEILKACLIGIVAGIIGSFLGACCQRMFK